MAQVGCSFQIKDRASSGLCALIGQEGSEDLSTQETDHDPDPKIVDTQVTHSVTGNLSAAALIRSILLC